MAKLMIVQIIVANIIGYFIATLFLIRTLFLFIRSPISFVKGTFFNKRRVMPTCLNDPRLGNHGFIHLEVSVKCDCISKKLGFFLTRSQATDL